LRYRRENRTTFRHRYSRTMVMYKRSKRSRSRRTQSQNSVCTDARSRSRSVRPRRPRSTVKRPPIRGDPFLTPPFPRFPPGPRRNPLLRPKVNPRRLRWQCDVVTPVCFASVTKNTLVRKNYDQGTLEDKISK